MPSEPGAGGVGHHHDAGEIMESKQSAHRPGGPDATGWPLHRTQGLSADRKTTATSARNVAAADGQVPWPLMVAA